VKRKGIGENNSGNRFLVAALATVLPCCEHLCAPGVKRWSVY